MGQIRCAAWVSFPLPVTRRWPSSRFRQAYRRYKAAEGVAPWQTAAKSPPTPALAKQVAKQVEQTNQLVSQQPTSIRLPRCTAGDAGAWVFVTVPYPRGPGCDGIPPGPVLVQAQATATRWAKQPNRFRDGYAPLRFCALIPFKGTTIGDDLAGKDIALYWSRIEGNRTEIPLGERMPTTAPQTGVRIGPDLGTSRQQPQTERDAQRARERAERIERVTRRRELQREAEQRRFDAGSKEMSDAKKSAAASMQIRRVEPPTTAACATLACRRVGMASGGGSVPARLVHAPVGGTPCNRDTA